MVRTGPLSISNSFFSNEVKARVFWGSYFNLLFISEFDLKMTLKMTLNVTLNFDLELHNDLESEFRP